MDANISTLPQWKLYNITLEVRQFR
jgi:hypothetical protein